MTVKAISTSNIGWNINNSADKSASYTVQKACNCIVIAYLGSAPNYPNTNFGTTCTKNSSKIDNNLGTAWYDHSCKICSTTAVPGDVLYARAYGTNTSSYGGVGAVILTDELL